MEHFIQLNGALFEQVQLGQIFVDSKTFVDCYPRYEPAIVLAKYHQLRQHLHFDLGQFVARNFIQPHAVAKELRLAPNRTMAEHIESLWDILTRAADPDHNPYSSLIPLPEPFVVPGGRFVEIYYWDTYFTAEGLAVSGRIELVSKMIKNFAYLINRCGFIPNGNRHYYLSRSQPPFFCALVALLYRYQGIAAIQEYLPLIEKEYHFWMSTARRVELTDGSVLNRYWDELAQPRPESFKEDIELAQYSPDPASCYRNIRAACESGWDFSSRWCRDPNNLASINTSEILPVDLNAILYGVEFQLASWYQQLGHAQKAHEYWIKAAKRKDAIDHYLWDNQHGFYFDYNFVTGNSTPVWSLAAVYPLFFRQASLQQAQQVMTQLERHFVQFGGVMTTLSATLQQWDAPNGWAPLQWLTVIGLRNYGFYELAEDIAQRFITNVRGIFNYTSRIMEKYNVLDLSLAANGGEYPLQDGFGWTNGVVAALWSLYPEL